MIGFHFTRPVRDWPRAVAALPAGAWVKAVDNVQLLAEAKATNPDVRTVLRHWYDDRQVFGGTWAQLRARAQAFFATFVDDTFRRHACHVDAVEEWNEYLAPSQTAAERRDRERWATAAAAVWQRDYRSQPDYAHIRLVLANAAVGNDIPEAIAAAAHAHDCILGYHPYIPVRRGALAGAGRDWWTYFAGRWAQMDAGFVARGWRCDWLGTEGGAVLQHDGGHLGPLDGWRHPDALAGNVHAYLAVLDDFRAEAQAWNRRHGDRFLGAVLFNSGDDRRWRQFDLRQPELDALATWATTPDPPAPDGIDPDLATALWDASLALQGIRLNGAAALQRAITGDGYAPVGNEGRLAHGGVTYALQPAEHLAAGRRRVYYAVAPRWDDVRWLGSPGSPGTEDLVGDPVDGDAGDGEAGGADGAGFALAAWPTEAHTVTQPFGARPDHYRRWGLPGHEGVDLRAPRGARVFAAHDGLVVVAGDNGGAYGNQVRLRHERGDVTVYAHLARVLVDVGDDVRAGHVIGLAGDSGRAEGAHLHFMWLRPYETYVDAAGRRWPAHIFDPTPLLAAAANAGGEKGGDDDVDAGAF